MFDWKQLQPGDGYFAELLQLHSRVALTFGLRVGGKIVKERTVAEVGGQESELIDPITVGLFKRRLIVLEAMAEYLNAGGDVRDLRTLLPHPDEGSIWTEGWNYFDGGVDPVSGNHVHEFANNDCTQFVRWVRHDYIDSNLTLEEISDDTVRASAPGVRLDQDDFDAEGQIDCEMHRLPGT